MCELVYLCMCVCCTCTHTHVSVDMYVCVEYRSQEISFYAIVIMSIFLNTGSLYVADLELTI